MAKPLKHPSLLTADDWGLYKSDMDCTRAVSALNDALLNACMATNANDFHHTIRGAMQRWSEYGAYDGDAGRLVDSYYEGVSARFTLGAMKAPSALTADDWQLYKYDMDCTDAVKDLNKALADGIASRVEAQFRNGMDAMCRKYESYGANDSDALRVVERYRRAAFAPLPFAANDAAGQVQVKAGVEVVLGAERTVASPAPARRPRP